MSTATADTAQTAVRRVSQIVPSLGEAIEMAKNLTAEYRQPLRVVFFPRATPRRCAVCDVQTYAREYEGRDWAVLKLSTEY